MTSVNWFPFIVWVQRITHRASDLATNDSLHWAILSTPILTLCVVDGNNNGWFSSSVTPPHVLHYYIIISNKSWMGIVPQSKVNLTLKSERYWLENWRGRNKECKRQRKEPQDVGGFRWCLSVEIDSSPPTAGPEWQSMNLNASALGPLSTSGSYLAWFFFFF